MTDMGPILYTLGALCRVVYPDITDINDDVLAKILTHPVEGLGKLHKHIKTIPDKDRRQVSLALLLDRIPADLQDPPGGIPAAVQCKFWLGYWQYSSALDHSRKYGPAELARIGEALFGPHWQADLVRELGLSDTRRVRGWLSGESRVPPGVWVDLLALIRQRQTTLAEILGEGAEPKSETI